VWQRHGVGKYTAAHGEVYEGEWSENLPHGHGVYHEANGDVYEGALLGGHRTGSGQIQYSNGDKYEGEVCACCMLAGVYVAVYWCVGSSTAA
jgi:hypothetical protein